MKYSTLRLLLMVVIVIGGLLVFRAAGGHMTPINVAVNITLGIVGAWIATGLLIDEK